MKHSYLPQFEPVEMPNSGRRLLVPSGGSEVEIVGVICAIGLMSC